LKHFNRKADIPVAATNVCFNLTTAKALGLAIPASFLSLADALVE